MDYGVSTLQAKLAERQEKSHNAGSMQGVITPQTLPSPLDLTSIFSSTHGKDAARLLTTTFLKLGCSCNCTGLAVLF